MNTQLTINKPGTSRGFSSTLWSDAESVVTDAQVIFCNVVSCCFNPCVSACVFRAVGCPNDTGCQVQIPCGQNIATQDFTARSYWYTFRTYYCGYYCPYMNYKMRANHRFQSSLPNANLSSNYQYRLNGTTYTFSQTGASSIISISLTHQLGIINKNDPDYIPNILHVSAQCTGTAVNGQTVTLN